MRVESFDACFHFGIQNGGRRRLSASYVTFLLVTPSRSLVSLMIVNMAVSCAAFFALRGIYFALLEESDTPSELTGTAVEVICFVGFTPEIFMPPLTGWLISDARSCGNVLAGYDRIYWILIALSLLGLLAAGGLRRLDLRSRSEENHCPVSLPKTPV